MPICITCSTPVKNLYTTYSKADDRSLGKGVRLTQCPKCKRFADKYVEHDYIVLFIDLVLIKPQVYRHLLFNRLWTPNDALDPSIIRLGILLILFDVYITWARIERTNSTTSTANATPNSISNAPIITQYFFFLTLNVVATIVQHSVIRTLAKVFVKPRPDGTSNGTGHETKQLNGSPKQHHAHHQHHLRNTSSPSKFRAQAASSSTPTVNLHANSNAHQTPGMATGTGISTSASTTALDEASAAAASRAPTTSSSTHIQSHHSSSSTTTAHQPQIDTSPPQAQTTSPPTHTNIGEKASPSAISTALLVSSCTKLFPILLVIWPTSISSDSDSGSSANDWSSSTPSSLAPFAHRATSYIGWIVLLNNIEALLILLNCGYVVATSMAVAGLVTRWIVEGWILSAVGLVRELEGPVGDVISICRWVVGSG